MRKHGTFPIGGGDNRSVIVGGVSMLSIFAVLCLAVFALLSLLRSESDLKLSRKTADMTQAYYQADSQAEQRLAEWIPILEEISGKTKDEKSAVLSLSAQALQSSYDQRTEEITWQIPIAAGQALIVVIKPLDQAPCYQIQSWKEDNRSEYDSGQTLPVWNGGAEKDR